MAAGNDGEPPNGSRSSRWWILPPWNAAGGHFWQTTVIVMLVPVITALVTWGIGIDRSRNDMAQRLDAAARSIALLEGEQKAQRDAFVVYELHTNEQLGGIAARLDDIIGGKVKR